MVVKVGVASATAGRYGLAESVRWYGKMLKLSQLFDCEQNMHIVTYLRNRYNWVKNDVNFNIRRRRTKL